MKASNNHLPLELPHIPTSSKDLAWTRFRQQFRLKMWRASLCTLYFIKRIVDLVISFTALIICLPLLLLVSLAIYLENPGPVLFVQKRVGLNGKLFSFFKFRSMVINAEALKSILATQNESKDGVIFKMKRDPRITRIGRIIRRYSIDELPQVLNVIRGEMSIVGPRPPVPAEVAQYNLHERQRLSVKPGLTCIWQVSGRSEVPFHRQVEMDLQYIRKQSLWSDIRLILRTIPAVLLGKGAY